MSENELSREIDIIQDPILARQNENPEDIVSAEITLSEQISQDREGLIRRNLGKLSLGVFAVSTAVSLSLGSGGEIIDKSVDNAPWLIAAAGSTEAMWIGGAAMMLASAGKKIGNPLKIKARWEEVKEGTSNSRTFRNGLNVNAAGAVGTAGTIAIGAVATLPPETWPGAFGIAAADLAATAAIRAPIYQTIKEYRKTESPKGLPKPEIRLANHGDIERLTEIDLQLFKSAYGEEVPEEQEVRGMLSRRLENSPGWFFVAEIDGKIEGFASGFRTNVAATEFVSWEESTNGGTLDGKVDPDGHYVYVTNMTAGRTAVRYGAEKMLLSNLLANCIEEGVDYGYFVSRMPRFQYWIDHKFEGERKDKTVTDIANHYMELRRGDGQRYDPQLRTYEKLGYSLVKLAENAFDDEASLNYGVVCVADIPPKSPFKKLSIIRKAMAYGLRKLAANPKYLDKVIK